MCFLTSRSRTIRSRLWKGVFCLLGGSIDSRDWDTQISADFRDKTTSFLFFFEYQNLFSPFPGKTHHFKQCKKASFCFRFTTRNSLNTNGLTDELLLSVICGHNYRRNFFSLSFRRYIPTEYFGQYLPTE